MRAANAPCIMMEEFAKYAPPFIQAISIAVTAIFAVLGLNAWRRQLKGRRKFEIAEDAYAAFDRAVAALTWIRNPAGYSGEGKTRERGEYEEEGVARLRDSYHTKFERIKETNSDFDPLFKLKPLVRVHFGDDLVSVFDAVIEARLDVSLATRMLIETAGHPRSADDKHWRKWEEAIWRGIGQPDPIDQKLSNARVTLERLLLPVLR